MLKNIFLGTVAKLLCPELKIANHLLTTQEGKIFIKERLYSKKPDRVF